VHALDVFRDARRNRPRYLGFDSIRHAFRAVVGIRTGTAPSADAPSDLGNVIADLEQMNGRTEQDFLVIGEKLVEFLGSARQLSSGMTALGELITGADARHASEVLGCVLNETTQMQARAGAGDRALAEVSDSTRQIERTFLRFGETVAVFRVLASLTRIETARLGSAGAEFGNLAEEVQSLTHSIESSGRGILDATAGLNRHIESTLARITALQANELRELPAIMAEVAASLRSLEERHQRAGEQSARQAGEYQEVSAAIEDLITAIQFHDITRQQIEHVADALKRVRDVDMPTADQHVTTVLTLQSSQLSNAGQVFSSSTRRIESDLDSIAERVASMAEGCKTLLGFSADEGDSFFLQMEARLTAILNAVAACARAEEESRTATVELDQIVTRIRESVEQVRDMENRIHRIALNATIRAVQLGGAGNALNVVAEAMQRLAMDSSEITEQVGGVIDRITAAASGLSQRRGEFEDRDVLPEIQKTIAELHSSSEASLSRVRSIADIGSRLGAAIHDVRSGFTVGKLVADGIESARATLEKIAGAMAPPSLDGSSGGEQHLHDLAARYTMQAERDVHQAIVAGAPVAEKVAESDEDSAVVTVPAGDDFGDNVELF